MSNVLIGIIGVILFIGLALAGALILGDDFKMSRHTTKAAAVTQQLQQFVAAVNMFKLKTGQQMLASTYATNGPTLTPRFLATVPVNPMNNRRYLTADDTGGFSATPATFVYTDLAGTEEAKAVCRAIEEGAGAANPDASIAEGGATASWALATQENKRVGCVRISATEYDAYVPI